MTAATQPVGTRMVLPWMASSTVRPALRRKAQKPVPPVLVLVLALELELELELKLYTVFDFYY